MKDIITETINEYLMKESFYWGDGDLREIDKCKKSLTDVYNRMLNNGLTKNVYMVQQLGDIISRLDKLVQQ